MAAKKKRQKRESKEDRDRLVEIVERLILPFEDDRNARDLYTLEKLSMSFKVDEYPIYKRKVEQKIKIYGLWWMDSDFKWLHAKHQGLIYRDVPDKILTNRIVDKNTNIIVRECFSGVDLECICSMSEWDSVKKKHKSMRKWFTVSVSYEEYFSLDESLGPREDVCSKHQKENILDIYFSRSRSRKRRCS